MSRNRDGKHNRKMPGKLLTILLATSFLATGCTHQFLVLNPAGPVAEIEKRLILISTLLVLLVIVPVFVLFGYIVFRYRDKPGNQAPYQPEWSESNVLEVIWWGIPILIVGLLGAYTARDTFALTKPPMSASGPLTVQVMSLNWKWLFLYPDQKVATVNYCEIPTGRPVQFVLTANAPMNSFWVPELGGQEYTMPGMAMHLWLQADKSGVYFGHGANFTGEGYAHMKFDVIARPQTDFNRWVQTAKQSANPLSMSGYQALVKPSVVDKQTYSAYPGSIFADTVKEEGGMYMKHARTDT